MNRPLVQEMDADEIIEPTLSTANTDLLSLEDGRIVTSI